MIADIKPRAKEIMKADGLNLTIGAGIFVLIGVLAAQIGGGIISDALSGLITSVCAACSACFLVIIFQIFGKIQMDHRPYIRLVDAHTKSVGRYHHPDFARHPILLP